MVLEQSPQEIEILECTLRDGSYAIDFKFTDQDTSILCQKLDEVGFKYIEIGHGVGINASEKGIGFSPYSETHLIEVAKKAAPNANIGMFCISGIATLESISTCSDVGLDFIRIGCDVTETEKALPVIEHARKQGLFTCFNLMKSYAVTPEKLAIEAEKGAQAGAQVAYVVDSSGGMLPSSVASYVESMASRLNIPIGYHGHDNLRMGVANSLQAIESGAKFIDSTIYGLGRSAGNAPTEALLAILKKQGYDIDIDLFEVLKIGQDLIRPLVKNIESYDMTSVAMGFGDFHSSFFPKVKAEAELQNVNLNRLIAAIGQADPVDCKDEILKKVASEIPKSNSQATVSETLIRVDKSDMQEDRIHQGIESLEKMINTLTAAASKYPRRILLDLSVSSSKDDAIISEYLTEDDHFVLGRAVFGSREVLSSIFHSLSDRVSSFLVDQDNNGAISLEEIISTAGEFQSSDRLILYSGSKLWESYLSDTISSLALDSVGGSVLIFGHDSGFEKVKDLATGLFQNIVWYASEGIEEMPTGNHIHIESLKDWKDLDLGFDLIICFETPNDFDLKKISSALNKDGIFFVKDIKTAQLLSEKRKSLNPSVLYLDPANIYHGQWEKWKAVKNKDFLWKQD